MKMYRTVASILFMTLLLALHLPTAYSEEIIPFAAGANTARVTLSFSNGNAIGNGKITKLEAGCTSSTRIYIQAKSKNGWITKASGSGIREASSSCTAQKGIEYRAYIVVTIINSEGKNVDTIKSYSSSSVY